MAADRDTIALTAADADRLLAPFAAVAGLGLAVSGGADSVALMRLVAGWRARTRPDLPVVAFTVDHGLRPEAAEEARQVALWARDTGLEHRTLVWEGRKPSAGIPAAAREARYRLLVEACAEHGVTHLLTAHHLDDQAETLLLRLARGSGVDGLSAMPETAEWPGLTMPGLIIGRPLLDVPKARLVATLRTLGQDWIEDPSNADARFARARLRDLIPALAREGMTARRLAETAKRMRRARAALEQTAADLHRSAVTADPAGFCRLDRKTLLAAPEEIGLRVLARLLMGVGGGDYAPRLDRLERLYARLGAESAGGAVTLSGCRIVIRGEAAIVFRETGRDGLPVERLDGPGTVVWDRRFRLDIGTGAERRALTVRALGSAGLARIREGSRLRDIPPAAARVAPGVFAGDRLVAAPLVEAEPGLYSPDGISFAFLGAGRFAAPSGDGIGASGGGTN
ncbi:tRNA lysidine(34) synthetase TilS [Microbaculum marinisediminis]|uniref:tRNA(Ile)-lysidine synthase n=1 Tax=Microbaculum marinisediminis TaxID=2931392 RepID=A0AAW5QXQ2_9HYPH|nr:tRNA lysidine(34) synthetase TilS [Microbaculum sp. A6E488]MCT8971742.1 tRNA lysidine(34) synthetase TilS [Microbaculum sp. A6E488]